MARIIVNEGTGPRSFELAGLVTVGSNPSCDVVLTHPTALGVRLELKPLKYGYRARVMKGEIVHNERRCDMADLDHNDTVRIGEVLVLYKQPEGAEGFSGSEPAGAAPATAAVDDLGGLEELEDLGGLEELDELDELDDLSDIEELDLDEIAEVEELDVFSLDESGLPELGEPEGVDDLDLLETVDLDTPVAEEAPGAGPHGGAVEEIDLLAGASTVEEETGPAEVPPALDDAFQRARWKRLEALRRLQLGIQGDVREWPDLADPGALDTARELDASGGAAGLDAFEAEHDLTDHTLKQLLALTPAAFTAATADAFAELPPLEAIADEQAQPDEIEAFEELPALDALEEEPEELDVVEELQVIEEVAVASEAVAQRPDEVLEALDELDELDELEELDELVDVAEAEEAVTAAPAARRDPPASTSGRRRSTTSTASTGARRSGRTAGAPARAASVAYPVAAPIAVSAAAVPPPPATPPADARPLPAEGIRFSRPLPPGHRPPDHLPPPHPGRRRS